MNAHAKIQYWFNLAHYDYKTAQSMRASKRYLYVGFFCHQTIEKTLKGIYIAKFQRIPPYTHNLIRLIELCDIDISVYNTIIEELNPLNIEARYPNYKKRIHSIITPKRAAELLKKTKELFGWLLKKK